MTTYRVAVRALCEFAAKQGDLDLQFTPNWIAGANERTAYLIDTPSAVIQVAPVATAVPTETPPAKTATVTKAAKNARKTAGAPPKEKQQTASRKVSRASVTPAVKKAKRSAAPSKNAPQPAKTKVTSKAATPTKKAASSKKRPGTTGVGMGSSSPGQAA